MVAGAFRLGNVRAVGAGPLACRRPIWKDLTVRRVVVCSIASVDGFYAASDGNPLVLNMDAARSPPTGLLPI